MMNSFLTRGMGIFGLAGAVAIALALLAPTNAIANIYAFKDENGVTRFSNLPHLGKR